MEKDIEKMDQQTFAEAVYALLRREARRPGGGYVYRPARPEALFVSTCRPAEEGIFRIREEKGRFFWSLGREGISLLNTTFFADAAGGRVPPVEKIARTEEEAVLYTHARFCMERGEPALFPDDMLELVLHRLAFGEEKLLCRELPALYAKKARTHAALSAWAGRLVMDWLEKRGRDA